MPTKAEIEQRHLNILAVRALEQGGLSAEDIKRAPELAAKAMEMAKAKKGSASSTSPQEPTMKPNTAKPRMMNEMDIFTALSASPQNYKNASPEERAIYDGVIAKRKKKATVPDTAPVAGPEAAAPKKEPTASEIISMSISSFADNFTKQFNAGSK